MRRDPRGICATPCADCHDRADSVAPGIKARLAAQCPHDKAPGYAAAPLLGAISVKRPP